MACFTTHVKTSSRSRHFRRGEFESPLFIYFQWGFFQTGDSSMLTLSPGGYYKYIMYMSLCVLMSIKRMGALYFITGKRQLCQTPMARVYNFFLCFFMVLYGDKDLVINLYGMYIMCTCVCAKCTTGLLGTFLLLFFLCHHYHISLLTRTWTMTCAHTGGNNI